MEMGKRYCSTVQPASKSNRGISLRLQSQFEQVALQNPLDAS
jgi:hypothetical protein